MTRDEVYKLIDGERDYQNQLGPERTDGSAKSVGDYIVMLNHYLLHAQRTWTLHPGTDIALGCIRSVAAIAVRCMEDHGAPPRDDDTPETDKTNITTWDGKSLTKVVVVEGKEKTITHLAGDLWGYKNFSSVDFCDRDGKREGIWLGAEGLRNALLLLGTEKT